jgi:cytochrome c-type biogenesis protein CcmE
MNGRFLLGGSIIAAAVAWLVVTGIRETSSYYLTTQEFLPRKDTLAGQPVRVAGRVRPGTVRYDPKSLRLAFEMGEPGRPQDAGPAVAVDYTGIKPDMFAEGRDVIVEGRYVDGTLRAEKVLTSCPSKYEAKREAETSSSGSN